MNLSFRRTESYASLPFIYKKKGWEKHSVRREKRKLSLFYNKSLKIPKGVIETVIRRTVHTVGKRTNNDQQNITQKTNDRATRTPLKTLDELVFFIDNGLLVTRKLLNQGFLLVKLKSSLRIFDDLDLINS
jgi:hypothetical protein